MPIKMTEDNPRGKAMSLGDILTKLAETDSPIVLSDGDQDFQAKDLLGTLSEPRLKTPAHMQPGMYIAEINDRGYLGRILYRVKAS